MSFDTPDPELTVAYERLTSNDVLSKPELEQIIGTLDRILRSDDAEIDWDDAWDAMDFFGPNRAAALDRLSKMAHDRGNDKSEDHYARKWALRVIKRLDVEPELLGELIGDLVRDPNQAIRGEARRCIKPPQKSFWLNWFSRK